MSHTSHLNFIFIKRENYFTKEFFLIFGIFRLNCLLEFNILHCGRLIMWKQEKVKSCYSLELLLSLNTTSRTINTVVMWLLAYKHLVRGLWLAWLGVKVWYALLDCWCLPLRGSDLCQLTDPTDVWGEAEEGRPQTTLRHQRGHPDIQRPISDFRKWRSTNFHQPNHNCQ